MLYSPEDGVSKGVGELSGPTVRLLRVLMLERPNSTDAAIIPKITCLASLASSNWNRWRISALTVSVLSYDSAPRPARMPDPYSRLCPVSGDAYRVGTKVSLPQQDPLNTIRLRM